MFCKHRKALPLAIAFVLARTAITLADSPEPPQKMLQAEAKRIAVAQLKLLGKGYQARFDANRRLIYISALDDEHFDETAALLACFTDALRKTLLPTPLPWNVTVVLPTTEDYKTLAPAEGISGFYRPAERTLISVDRGRVLLHEFTHALHHADAFSAKQEHPVWVCEGLASLFEASEISEHGLRPRTDRRLLKLQEAVRKKTSIPLDRLVKMGRKKFHSDAELCYAEARYLMLYLCEKQSLKRWYEAFKADYETDPTGLKSLEKILGNRVFAIEDDWKKWVKGLRVPWGEAASSQGRLGIEVHDAADGVKIVGLVPGGAAERAGRLKVGDVIVKFNGHEISNPADLVGAIRAAGAMQTVTVEIIRHGNRKQIRQPLGSAKSG